MQQALRQVGTAATAAVRSIGAVETALARLGGRQRAAVRIRTEIDPQSLARNIRAAVDGVNRQPRRAIRFTGDLDPRQIVRDVLQTTQRIERDPRNRIDLTVDVDEASLRRARAQVRRVAQEARQRQATAPTGTRAAAGDAARTQAAAQQRLQAERRLNEAVLRSQENFLRARVRADQQNLALRRRLFDAETERRVQGLQRQYQRLAQETRAGEQRVNRIIERFRRQRSVERVQVAVPQRVPAIPAPTAAIAGFGRLRTIVGSVAGLLAFSGGARAIGSLVRLSRDFQQEMNAVRAVVGGTTEELQRLEDVARELGGTTQFSAVEAAGGMRFLARAGFDTNEILGAIGPTLDLAAAGMLGVAEAGDIVTNVLKQFGLQATDTTKAADILAVVASNSNTSIQSLGSALSFVGLLARTAGLDLETTATAIGILGDAGIAGERAGTALRGILASLADVTPKAEDALRALNLGVADINVEMNGLVPVLERLRDANLRNADAFAIFARRAAPGVLALINAIPAFRELRGQADNATGSVRQMAETMNSRLPGALKLFVSAAKEAGLAIGDAGLTGAVIGVLNAFTTLLQQNPEFTRNIGVALGGIVRGTATAFVTLAGGVQLAGKAIGGVTAILADFARLDFAAAFRTKKVFVDDFTKSFERLEVALNQIQEPPEAPPALPSPESIERQRRAAAPLVGPEPASRAAGAGRLQTEQQLNAAILAAQRDFLQARINAERDNSALRLQLFDEETRQQLQAVRDQSAALQAQVENSAFQTGRRELNIRERAAQTRIALEGEIADQTDAAQRDALQKRLAGLDLELQVGLDTDRIRATREQESARARITQLATLESTLQQTRNLERQRLEDDTARQSMQRQQRLTDAALQLQQDGLQIQLDRDRTNVQLQEQLFDLETDREVAALRERFAQLVATTANGQAQLDQIIATFQQNRATQREDLGGRGDARERVRDLQQEVAAQRDLADAARLTGRARQDAVASRRLEADLVRQGIDLTSQEAAEIRALNAELVASRRATEALDTPLRRLADSGITNFELIQTAAANAFGSMEDTLVEFVTTGKLNFSGLVDSILQDLSRIAVQQAIIQPLAQGLFDKTKGLGGSSFGSSSAGGLLGSLFSSGGGAGAGFQQGGVFPGGGGGGVTRRPTVFGIAGEGGPEAIVPLSGGRSIPVELAGGGADNRTFNITIATPNPEAFTSQRTQSQIRSAISEATDRDRLVDGGRRR